MFSITRSSSHQQNRLDPRCQPSRKRAAQPRLEWLEGRSLLSTTYAVTNLADSGPGSLRAAIDAANANPGADAIAFAPNLHGTITLTNPDPNKNELKITDSLTITGPGANNLTVSGTSAGISASRVFEIGTGATVTISGLTIANGQTTSTGTTTDGALGGGGILIDVGATLKLTSSAVVNNKASAGADLDVFGGGVLNLGTATVTYCTFTGNQALGGASGTFFGGSVGGAIDNFGGAMLTVTGSTFSNNQAISTDQTGIFYGIGGAIENNAGFDQAHPSTATIRASTFTDNQAKGGGLHSSGNGGAIDNEGAGATMTLTNSSLIDNQSIGGAQNNGLGGGIMNASGSTLTVTSSTFLGNQAKGGPGGTELFNSLGEGGGIQNATADLTVNNSTFSGNQALGGTGGGDAIGGGIENAGAATLHLNNSTFSGNQAIAGSGSTKPNRGLAAGGGLDNSFFSSTATITSCLFINNQALGGSGGPGVNGGDAVGGGIAVGSGVFFDFTGFSDASSLTITRSTIASNQAIGGVGGSGANGGNGWGGGIWFGLDSTGTLDTIVITGNSAQGGLAGAGGITDGQGVGGGVYVTAGADVHAKKSHIVGNFASTSDSDVHGTITFS